MGDRASERRSPYEDALGASLDELHPRLRAYFSAIPYGSVGVGTGVFDTVGTPRRWLWPLLWPFGRAGVMFGVWERDVPFTVVNRPVIPDVGVPAVASERIFHLASGDRTMVDRIASGGGLSRSVTDALGSGGRVHSRLEASIVDGSLRLRSTAVAVRIARLTIRIPGVISPVVTLVERWDDDADEQRVSIVVDAPLIGRLYEYAGRFTYAVRPGEATP